MRIIDKNKDFYDYLQGIYPDFYTFDRRGSISISRNDWCAHFSVDDRSYDNGNKYCVLLLSIGYTRFLYKVNVVKSDSMYREVIDFNTELIHKWKDYDHLSEFTLERLYVDFWKLGWKNNGRGNEEIIKCVLNKYYYSRVIEGAPYGNKKGIIILKESGIPSCTSAEEIYFAFVEYFTALQENSEKTESKGLSNNEKIENHGFDKKSSFRNVK